MNKNNRKRNILFFVFLSVISLIFAGCSPIRKYPAGSYLLKKNTIHVDNKKIDKEQLYALLKQQPNKRNFGLYWNIRFWNYSNRGKDSKFKKWVKRSMAAEPVLYDSIVMATSNKQLKYYLQNHGYFNATVTNSAKFKRRNARVSYEISSGKGYKINSVSYIIKDATIKALVYSTKADCYIRPGDQYSLENIDLERERINRELQSQGYYTFNKEFIRFIVDTAFNNHEASVAIKISDPLVPSQKNQDSLVLGKHKRYTLDKITIFTNYELGKNTNIHYDTTVAIIPNRFKDRPPRTFYLAYPKKLRINKRTIAQALYFDRFDTYNYQDIEKTYQSLLDLRLFKYVTIDFDKIHDTLPASGTLNCNIKLSRAPVQSITFSTEATHSGGELGFGLGTLYTNKNLFRGAEIFGLKLNGAIEFQSFRKNTGIEKPVIEKLRFINSIEAGVDLQLRIPRFLLPINQESLPKNFKPITNIMAAFNYQIRPQYERFFTSVSFGYQWKESPAVTHFITPIQIDFVKIHPDSAFAAQLEALNDKTLKNSYQDHITTALSYTFLFNTQQVGKLKDFYYLKANAEFAGFLFYLFSKALNRPGAYTLLNVPYSQFYKIDADFRYYKYLNSQNVIVTRAYAGYGSPYEGVTSLPFEKSFYMGGANSMRAWRLKKLGPGSFHPEEGNILERIGEVALEANVEYRFPIYKFFKGAVFVDMGNIWLRKANESQPGAEFRFNKFYKDIAFDGGLGLRADFDYFIVRLDGAFVLKDPAQPVGSRWIGQNNNRFLVFGNFAIGYPF